jgi:hypothetical protein
MIFLAPLIVHVGGGLAGIASGAAALSVTKGERLHRIFGTIFLGAMAVMATVALYLAIALQQRGNIGAALFALYLVTTAWMTVRQRENTVGTFNYVALLVIASVSVLFLSWGLRAAASPHGALDGYAAAFYYVFAGVAAFFTLLDFKVVLRGGVAGTQRIARHLWRMCFALFFATGSFFLGQQKVMPKFMHGSPVLLALGLAPLGFLIFWMIRIRFPARPDRRTVAA